MDTQKIDIQKTISSLHPLERKILPLLERYSDIALLIRESKLQEVEVTRAIQWLAGKRLVEVKEDIKELVSLDKNGLIYLKSGLPERLFLNALNREMPLKDVEKTSKLSREEIGVCIGILKKKMAINIAKKGSEMYVSLTDTGRSILKKELFEELFLKKTFPVEKKALTPQELFAFNELIKRKNIIKTDIKKIKTVTLSLSGTEILGVVGTISNKNIVDSLNQDILKNRLWQGKEFRRYDLNTPVPRLIYGKKHFENEAIEYVKNIWMEMGFAEMSGALVQTAFWDLDTLFVPQDHPAREMQDTFYLKNPAKGRIPEDLKKKVKEVHETGSDTGSSGWGGIWDEEKAKQLMLRTHTTVISAQVLSRLKKENLPAKFFIVGKVFRNETPDWKHLFEFYQVDGIVVDPDATFTDLKGYLQEFFRKMGYEKIKIRPAHFPYTEPSVEVEVFNKEKNQWIELGGAGIFRPEVTKTLLGFECPILAWGLGLGRVTVPYYAINDLRDFNKNDLKQLRSIKKWMQNPK